MSEQFERVELIDLCEQGVVQVGKWRNRDSGGAQRQLGEARALLKAGCEFQISGQPETNDNTIWIRISWPGFQSFEYGEGHDETDLFYIPTEARLKARQGGDWY